MDIAGAEALVRAYLDLWNARDVDAIWAHIYHPSESRLPWDEAGMRAALVHLAELGFDRSDLLTLTGREISSGLAEVQISFNRVTRDGQVLAPGLRKTLYTLRWTQDGWRITEMRPVD